MRAFFNRDFPSRLRRPALLAIAAASLLSARDGLAFGRWYEDALKNCDHHVQTGWHVGAPSKRLVENITDCDSKKPSMDSDYLRREVPGLDIPQGCSADFQYYGPDQPSKPQNPDTQVRRGKRSGLDSYAFRDTTRPPGYWGREYWVFGIHLGDDSGGAHNLELKMTVDFETDPETCRTSSLTELFDGIADSLRYVEQDQGKALPAEPQAVRPSRPKATTSGGADRSAESPAVRNRATKAARMGALNSRSRALIFEGALSTAEEKAKQAVKLNVRDLTANLIYATVLKLEGDLGGFGKFMEIAKKLRAHLDRTPADFLCGSGKDKGGTADDDAGSACLSISDGLIAEAFGKTRRALAAYSHAIVLNPGNWLAYALRGMTWISLKDCGSGVADLRQAVRLNGLYSDQAKYFSDKCPASD